MTTPNPHEPRQPPVVVWYKVLCLVMAAINVFLAGLGVWALSLFRRWALDHPEQAADLERTEWGLWLLIGMGVVFGIVNVAIMFLPPRPWTYLVHMTNILASGAFCCPLPLAIPVFIFWIREDTRAHYGMR
jgi:hypothetical protein